jgi:hypothetical protein
MPSFDPSLLTPEVFNEAFIRVARDPMMDPPPPFYWMAVIPEVFRKAGQTGWCFVRAEVAGSNANHEFHVLCWKDHFWTEGSETWSPSLSPLFVAAEARIRKTWGQFSLPDLVEWTTTLSSAPPFGFGSAKTSSARFLWVDALIRELPLAQAEVEKRNLEQCCPAPGFAYLPPRL